MGGADRGEALRADKEAYQVHVQPDMRLTLHSDYALRLLMLLAMEPDGLHTIEQVARRYGISRNHLMKVAQTLAQAGFIDSLRGRGGGLRLARAAASINLGAVLRATEDSFALVECFDRERNTCIVAPACGLRGPLDEALRAFLGVLDRYSLADLIGTPASLRRMRQLLAG
jgi:Rrf2 family transcriptional regulator, nitric oxide-sensitive transcriptional repressor